MSQVDLVTAFQALAAALCLLAVVTLEARSPGVVLACGFAGLALEAIEVP